MTTDITERAQREKFEAWWEREYKHLESSKYTDAVPHIKYGFWMAYQAGCAELVEALEKSESRLHEVAVACATAEQALEKAQAGEKQWREVVDAFCADDADWHKLTNSTNELIALLSQSLCKQADRIAELESRSVKLPKRSVGEVMHMSGFSRDYAEGWCSGNDNAIHEMRVAGINVIEGEQKNG
ncbi:hypothetical protein AAHX07_07190 [Klebsiella pneumoniae]